MSQARPFRDGRSSKPDQLTDEDTAPAPADAGMHPAPGARPGELIAAGPDHRWIAYESDGVMCVACHLGGLLRHDLAGWWVAGFSGGRRPVDDRIVATVGTAPDGWPALDGQAPLLGPEALRGEVAS